MTRIEDRLAAAAEELRRDVTAQTDVDTALARVTQAPARRRPYLLGAAAAVVLALLAGAALLAAGRDDRDGHVIADGVTTSTAPTATSEVVDPLGRGNVAFEVILETTTGVPIGTITYAGTESAFADQWRLGGLTGEPPTVDFDRRIVLSFTRSGCGESLVGLDLDGDRLRALLDDDGCAAPTEVQTVAVAVDRSALPENFHFVVPGAPDGSVAERSVVIDLATASTIVYPPAQGAPPERPDGPDLAPSDPGREITFDGVGDVRLGAVLDPTGVQSHEGSDCGYWGPSEPTHDGHEPLGGVAVGAVSASPRAISIMVRDPSYRTASGIGLGTSIATLQAVYGEDLVVDRSDGWEHPTDGLLALYQDVAAIRAGEHALTFYLRAEVVEAVKLSTADFWGDDEGCA